MDAHIVRHIRCGEIEIAATCEADSSHRLEVFYPATLLVYMLQGNLHIQFEEGEVVVREGTLGLIRKFSRANLYKSFSNSQGQALTYAFALTNSFIRKIIHDIKIPKDLPAVGQRFIPLPKSDQLKDVMESVRLHIDENMELSPEFVEGKTKEALEGIVKADPSLAQIFREYSLAERGDMAQFMNYNYLLKVPLERLAFMSGRSLSTFNREFKMIFNDTPHRWIMRKRLLHAKDLMIKENKRPSEVYLQVGFEDLAHFSRAFKKQFKVAPSRIQAG